MHLPTLNTSTQLIGLTGNIKQMMEEAMQMMQLMQQK
jgi:hypothetical protein